MYHVRPMPIAVFLPAQVFVNDSTSRTFLALLPDGGAPAIWHLIKRVDRVMLRHRLMPFYADPQPHVSLLWWSGDMREVIQQHMPQLQQLWGSLAGSWQCQVGLLYFFAVHHFVALCSCVVDWLAWQV